MSAAKKKAGTNARKRVLAIMSAAEAAGRAAEEKLQSAARERAPEWESSGGLERMRSLQEMMGRLDSLYPAAMSMCCLIDRRIDERARRYHLLVGDMIRQIYETEGHYYDAHQWIEAGYLWREIITIRDLLPA